MSALIQAGERAERTGAPALAAASYAAAAELVTSNAPDGRADAGALWERAAEAADISGDYEAAIGHAGRAHDYYLHVGDTRAVARAQVAIGSALGGWGRYAEARDQFTTALEVLRADPDADTVNTLCQLAGLEGMGGSPDTDKLAAEGLTFGQALGVDARQLIKLLAVRGAYFYITGRRTEAVAYYSEAARLAEEAGDNLGLGVVLVNLSDVLMISDPAAAAGTARTAAGHLRQAGARPGLATAIMNLAQALVMVGDWDGADHELTGAADSDGLPISNSWPASGPG